MAAIEAVPRHVFVPRWWTWHSAASDGSDVWELNDGSTDEHLWLDAAYADRSLVTQVGPLHADHASPGGLLDRAAHVVIDTAGPDRAASPARLSE